MIITIAKINRTLREGVSKKTGKQYSFESLGIAPQEEDLMDINGDSFKREERWVNGISKPGVTDDWNEGDQVKINLVRKTVPKRDGGTMEVINFALPEGVEPMVKKYVAGEQQEDVPDLEDF